MLLGIPIVTIINPQLTSAFSIVIVIFSVFILFLRMPQRYGIHYPTKMIILLSLISIDKLNDIYFNGLSIVIILSYIFSLTLILMLDQVSKYDGEYFYRFLRTVALNFGVAGLITAYLLNVPFAFLNRDISILLSLSMVLMLNMKESVKNLRAWDYLLYIAVTTVVLTITESRSDAGILILIFVLFHLISPYRTTMKIIILKILPIAVIALISFAIIYEVSIKGATSTTSLFTGRGLIWYAYLKQLFTSNQFLLGINSIVIDDSIIDSDLILYYSNNYTMSHIRNIILSGNTHSVFVFYLVNTGIVGFLLLLSFYYKSLDKMMSKHNFYLIVYCTILVTFQGRNIGSLYLVSNIFMIALYVPTKPQIYT